MTQKKNVHAIMDIKKLAPVLVKAVSDLFGVFTLVYFG